jgi:predicted GNAT family acetyltransferase
MTDFEIIHNAAASRFEATIDGHLCRADYQLADGVMRMTHTGVPRALAGRGIAGKLVAAALSHAQAQGYKAEPWCSYVRRYMQRHPESQALLPGGFAL